MISIIKSYLLESQEQNICKQIKNKFIVQEHKADKAGLHYDLRIENNCILKSWATRKLPQLISGELKRIALFQTPDHDPTWFNFSGEIESGYGKGTVSIWDTGAIKIIKWTDDKIMINFKGSKLSGNYVILFYKDNQWLMIKTK